MNPQMMHTGQEIDSRVKNPFDKSYHKKSPSQYSGFGTREQLFADTTNQSDGQTAFEYAIKE